MVSDYNLTGHNKKDILEAGEGRVYFIERPKMDKCNFNLKWQMPFGSLHAGNKPIHIIDINI